MSNTNASNDLPDEPQSAAVDGESPQEKVNQLTNRVEHLETALQKQEELNLQMAQTLAKTSRVLLKLTEKVTGTVPPSGQQIVQETEE